MSARSLGSSAGGFAVFLVISKWVTGFWQTKAESVTVILSVFPSIWQADYEKSPWPECHSCCSSESMSELSLSAFLFRFLSSSKNTKYWPAAQTFHLGKTSLLPSLLLLGLYKHCLNGKTSQFVITGKSLAAWKWLVLPARPFLVELIRSSARVICCQEAQPHWNKSVEFNDFLFPWNFTWGWRGEWKIFWSYCIFSFNLARRGFCLVVIFKQCYQRNKEHKF